VHSAEVTEKDEQGRSLQEVAEPADAVVAVNPGLTQRRGERLAEPHALSVDRWGWRDVCSRLT